MKSIYSCILSLSICLLCSQASYAQNGADTIRTQGIRIGVDVGKIAYYFLTNNTNKTLEFTADMSYKKLLLVGEAGYSMLDIAREKYTYSSNGLFARAGIEHNLLKGGGDNYIFVGARYGIGQFSYQVSDIVLEDNVWGTSIVNSDQQNVTAHWGEAVGGVKVNMFGHVFLGFTARFKLRVAQSDYAQVDPLLIPGFGNPVRRNAMGFNYYVYYLIPFKKK
jgi:hypothetical protein